MLTVKPQTGIDYTLLTYFWIILLVGLIILTSAATGVGHEKFHDSYFFIKHQILFGLLPGLAFFFICLRVDYHLYKKCYVPIFILSLGLLVAVFIPGIGSSLGTAAKSWLVFGPVSFQPTEIAKLGLIIFLAGHLSNQGKKLEHFTAGFLVALGLGLLPLALVLLQPDIGTAAIFFAIILGMLFVGNANLLHLSMLTGGGVGGFLIMILAAPYRTARLTIFLHPELDPLGIGYHINQALLAVGSGGWLGLGLGHSRQKFAYLPEVQADSIFAILGEEMGFLFTAGFVFLTLAIFYRSLKIAKRAPDQFGKLLVTGIMIWFMAQAFLNIGAMVGLLPLTGVPLPFVSHGGTALIMALVMAGIVLNVGRYADV